MVLGDRYTSYNQHRGISHHHSRCYCNHSGQACLIARTVDSIITWLWVDRENGISWMRLLQMVPEPQYVVCDVQKGLLVAIDTCWPSTIVQRCRFHVWLNVRQKLTLHPESLAGQELLSLTRQMLHVKSRRQARYWKRNLKRWYKKHGNYLSERTVRQYLNPGQRRWFYTHTRLRSAYRQLSALKDDFLRSSYRLNPQLPRTTNHIEGGINSPIRALLKLHRGMPHHHQRRLVDWYLYSCTKDQKPTHFYL